MSSRGQVSENAGNLRLVRPVAVSVLIGAAVCALVLLLMSVLMTVRSIPQFAVDPMAGLALIAGGLAAGFCCARMLREKGMAHGALCGAVLTVLVVLAGFVIKDNGFGVAAVLKIVCIMLASMLGGVLGMGGKKRKLSKGKKRR